MQKEETKYEVTAICTPPEYDGMTLNEYQDLAMRTAIYPNDGDIAYLALAICGEAGELADKVKKVLRDKDGRFHQSDIASIALELGDIAWYMANMADRLGYRLTDVARMNIEKINGRLKRGTLHGTGDNR